MARLVGHHPANRKVMGSIPSQGTCLGYKFGPCQGVQAAADQTVSLTHQCFSPSFSPSLPLSLESMKENNKKF